MVLDVAEQVRFEVDDRFYGSFHDELARHRELDGVAVYASNGYSHSAACHEK